MASRKSPYKGADRFTEKAKDAGYPARSVFKLEEIDRRAQLLRRGQRVLDLGAAPGSWSLYAAQRIGEQGWLLAVDLAPLRTALPRNALFLQADAFTLDLPAVVAAHAPPRRSTPARAAAAAPPASDASASGFDVVLSDMAPNTTGNRFADQARSYDLFLRALELARSSLIPGGAFVGKIFMGEDFPLARAEVKKAFASERLIRPEGTRSVSYEIFIVGVGKR